MSVAFNTFVTNPVAKHINTFHVYYSNRKKSYFVDTRTGLSGQIKRFFFQYLTFSCCRNYKPGAQLHIALMKLPASQKVHKVVLERLNRKYIKPAPFIPNEIRSKIKDERLMEYVHLFRSITRYTPLKQLQNNEGLKKLIANFIKEFPLQFSKGPYDYLFINPLSEEERKLINPDFLNGDFPWLNKPGIKYTDDYLADADFKKILEKDLAFDVHGVEEAKGGIKNLINILVESLLIGNYAGRLIPNGDPAYTATSHGPYFVILEDSLNFIPGKVAAYPFECMAAFLVPNDEFRKHIDVVLHIAVEKGIISDEEKKAILQKVITYKEMAAFPDKAYKDMKLFKKAVAAKTYVLI